MAILIQFDDEELNRDYTEVATGGPTFETAIMGNPVGIHQRSIKRQDAIRTWDIQFGGLSRIQRLFLEQFYITKYGGGIAFRFFPPFDNGWFNDYQAVLGSPNGYGVYEIPLYRNYANAFRTIRRRIVLPVLGSEENLQIVNQENVVLNEGAGISNWEFLEGGFLRIYPTGTLPVDTQIFLTGGEFDVPAVFMNDDFEQTHYGPFTNADSVRIIELLPQAIMEVSETYTGDPPELDPGAPTAPSGLTIWATGSNSIAGSFTGSTDDVGVTNYRVIYSTNPSFSGIVLAYYTGNLTTFEITTLYPGTQYWMRVKAEDIDENLSLPSNVASATTNP